MELISFVLLISFFSLTQQQDCPPQKPSLQIINGVATCKECPFAWNPYLPTPACVSECPGPAPRVDPETSWCSPCPDDTPRWHNYECVACEGEEIYDNYRLECVMDCLPGFAVQDKQCVAIGSPPICPTGELTYYNPDPNVNACVHVCPEFTEGLSGICTACPANRPKWNNTDDPAVSTGVSCLAECPRNKPDYILNNICNFCDSGTPYWDNNTLTCVSECHIPTPSNTSDLWCANCSNATNNTKNYWYLGDNVCVEVCPPSFPTWDEDNICAKCPDEAAFWYNDTQTCLDKCPDWAPSWNENKWCEPCTVDKPFWNTTNQTCEICPDEQPYWDNNTQTCVEKCYLSVPDTPDSDVNRWCQYCNNSYPYWNNTIHQCVNTCPDTAPYINQSKWCLACTNPQPVWINEMKICNETCPIDIPDTNEIGWCVACDPSTPFYNSSTEQCEVCPDSAPYYNNDIRSCVVTCPLLKPDNDANKWCKPCGANLYWDNFTNPHTCTSNCPNAGPLKNISIYWCQACSDATPYYNKTNTKCISECKPPAPVIGADNWCEACPTEKPYWDPTLSTPGCVAACSPLVPFVNPLNVCISCPNNAPYWNTIDKACVATCPISMPYPNPTIKACQPCLGGTKWSYFSSSCVETCPASIPKLNSSNWCTDCTNPTPKWDPNYNGGDCVSSCPVSTPNTDAFNWCRACSIDYPKWDSSVSPGRCTSSCPVSMPSTGQYGWCQACPSSYHWDPITSSCTQTCRIPKPYVNSDNWCDVCPSTTPYWDAALPGCVSYCPHKTPTFDVNNQCQSCLSDNPYWESDSSKCVTTCPPLKPSVGTDNWCERCPDPTPYWFSGNSTCVEVCPPVAPAVDSINWCRECSGATLKWNPLSSTCVAECPESLPFWNSNTVPPACEAGPDIGDIVEYLDTAGIISTVVLAGMQVSMPGIPYVALSILLINMLKYIRYLDINYPPKPLKMFQRGSLDIPSLNFGPLFPQSWKTATYGHPAPLRFARYDINGLFIVNFWRVLTTTLIIIFIIGVLRILLKKNITNKGVGVVRDRAKIFLIWNYAFAFFTSNVGNIILFIFVEYRSFSLQDVIGTVSFLLTIIFLQISLVIVIYMIQLVIKTRKANKEKNIIDRQTVLRLNESFIVLLQKYKHDNLSQMLFVPIMCIRAALNAIIVAALHAPVVQCSLLVAMNIIMLAYYLKVRPHRELVDNIQLVAFETTLLVADTICLYLSTLPWEEQYNAEGAGLAIIVCNAIMFTLSIIFVLTRLIVALVRILRDRFKLKRPTSSSYAQTDLTRAESDISTEHSPQKKPAKGNRILSLSFESSAELNIPTEEDQSPTLKPARNMNKNSLRAFHVVTIPDNETPDSEEGQTSKYFDTEV